MIIFNEHSWQILYITVMIIINEHSWRILYITDCDCPPYIPDSASNNFTEPAVNDGDSVKYICNDGDIVYRICEDGEWTGTEICAAG